MLYKAYNNPTHTHRHTVKRRFGRSQKRSVLVNQFNRASPRTTVVIHHTHPHRMDSLSALSFSTRPHLTKTGKQLRLQRKRQTSISERRFNGRAGKEGISLNEKFYLGDTNFLDLERVQSRTKAIVFCLVAMIDDVISRRLPMEMFCTDLLININIQTFDRKQGRG